MKWGSMWGYVEGRLLQRAILPCFNSLTCFYFQKFLSCEENIWFKKFKKETTLKFKLAGLKEGQTWLYWNYFFVHQNIYSKLERKNQLEFVLSLLPDHFPNTFDSKDKYCTTICTVKRQRVVLSPVFPHLSFSLSVSCGCSNMPSCTEELSAGSAAWEAQVTRVWLMVW